MAVNTINFTTGPTTLPDVGVLSYNGCTFGPLFVTHISGTPVKDAARRTIKYVEYVLTVDGYVTFNANTQQAQWPEGRSIAGTMQTLQQALLAQGGALKYLGRGFDLTVNAAGKAFFNGAARDVAWGPVPELIEFQPLGAGLSAKVKWTVTVRVIVTPFVGKAGLLEFNCETTVSYGEDYYSSISIRGTMEIPLTRVAQNNRILLTTVDDRRGELDSRIFTGVDLTRFRVTRRNYNVSRDKRTMEWDVELEEKPYMDLPPGCTLARGSFSVRPVSQGAGLVNWLCTLRATYTVRADVMRRLAFWAFLAMLRLRMNQSIQGYVPGLAGATQITQNDALGRLLNALKTTSPVPPGSSIGLVWNKILKQQVQQVPVNAWLIDFSFDEGTYLESKTSSFSATWRLICSFETIMNASGAWRKLPERDTANNNLWAVAMKDISGSVSWLPNKLDPTADIIVDFGGG